jgi:hypothetical protein
MKAESSDTYMSEGLKQKYNKTMWYHNPEVQQDYVVSQPRSRTRLCGITTQKAITEIKRYVYILILLGAGTAQSAK